MVDNRPGKLRRWLGPAQIVLGLVWLACIPLVWGDELIGFSIARIVIGLIWMIGGIVLTVEYRRRARAAP